MNLNTILYVLLFILGVLINIFIGKIAKFIFKKDGTGPRLPLRILGVCLIINSISRIFHI